MVAPGPVVLEKESFVDGWTTTEKEPAYSISSPGASGAGELKRNHGLKWFYFFNIFQTPRHRIVWLFSIVCLRRVFFMTNGTSMVFCCCCHCFLHIHEHSDFFSSCHTSTLNVLGLFRYTSRMYCRRNSGK